jgi:hypothetical protein
MFSDAFTADRKVEEGGRGNRRRGESLWVSRIEGRFSHWMGGFHHSTRLPSTASSNDVDGKFFVLRRQILRGLDSGAGDEQG